jgi:RNA polymerase sigma-70 factor (ECF subfamily)
MLSGDRVLLLSPTHDDERRLIERCLEGEADAFAPLVERYHTPLFRAATRLLGDREAARDATQTAFVKAYGALGSYDPDFRFFSWIYRILLNDCLNRMRTRQPEALTADVAAPPAPDAVEVREVQANVRRALLLLPREQRDVIVLRHFAELSYDEVAVALKIPAKTVKSRLFAARQRLCELLAPPQV